MNRRAVIVAALTSGFLFTLAASGMTRNEDNWWPGGVRLFDDSAERPDEFTALGPLFSDTTTEAARFVALRPFWLVVEQPSLDAVSYHLLYPLANYYRYDGWTHWHILNLIRGQTSDDDSLSKVQIWPLFFQEDRPGEDHDTLALWPVGGHINNFFGRELDFWAWPLYVRSKRPGEIRYSTPWPFVQWRTGEASGFALWPLFGHFERPGRYDRSFGLWPLYYDYQDQFDQPSPRRRFGVLPFYARETAEGLRSETFLWPFFGYTEERAPRPVYDETRYFWPLLVQGRGDERYINRWMPFYTHERKREATKWWYLWPLLKKEEIELGFLTRHRTQFLFFLYRDERQTDGKDFSARRQYLWPFYSYWNNGNGRRQVQALDPFTVFMPSHQRFRENWTSLFTLYRFDERDDTTRQSWLWNFIVAEKSAEAKRLVVGPFYRHERRKDDSDWRILRGLVARSVTDGEVNWSFFWRSPKEPNR